MYEEEGATLGVKNVLGWAPITIADGVFFTGFFKSAPQMAALLREFFVKEGLPIPPPPNVNDTSLLSHSAYAEGDEAAAVIERAKIEVAEIKEP